MCPDSGQSGPQTPPSADADAPPADLPDPDVDGKDEPAAAEAVGDAAPAGPLPTHVVGIGASAGGLEALETFFDAMPAEANMAFVVVQHLSPDFKSFMNELLGRHTSMAIYPVEHGMAVQPNAVYLIPPKKEMIISGGRLMLTDKDPTQSLSLPIDVFFHSLAADRGERAVGVVLSGTGSDGSRGIRAIHEAGGLVIVQDEESAKFDGMPGSAIATGLADFVLPPEHMPDALLRFLNHPLGSDSAGAATTPSVAEGGRYSEVFELLREKYGLDFAFYKPNTVARRIERRMSIQRVSDLGDYVHMLRHSPVELGTMYKDLLIGVTQFFRDPEAFQTLRQELLEPMIARAGEEGLRMWVAGCATGEEVYSLAIILREVMAEAGKDVEVKIFATDVHSESLETAATGAYSEQSMENVSPQRRERFFQRNGDLYTVCPDLRKMVVFAQHDLIKDPPFTKLSLISCRNLLIYLQPIVQKKVLSLFHFALNTGGALFLGPSETLGDLEKEFDAVHLHWKMYTKRRDVRLPTDLRFAGGANPLAGQMPNLPHVPHGPPSRTDSRLSRAYDSLLDRYMPPSLLINDSRQLVHTFGDASRFLRPGAGRASLDILTLVEGDLRIALSAALQRATQEDRPVSYRGVRIRGEQDDIHVRLEVERLDEKDTRGGSYTLVTIHEVQAPPKQLPASEKTDESDNEQFDVSAESRQRISGLEEELQYTREHLQTVVEELETSNEELQASNEELLASNEELQSTNEELHSVNEELYTVNGEYERKIKELTQMTNDMDNLLRSTEIATIFLDEQLRIRKFTPVAASLFNLLPQDIGRPIDHIAYNLGGENQLIHDAHRVLEDGTVIVKEVQDRGEHWLLKRVLPYRDENQRLQGVVVTFVDIAEIKATEMALRDTMSQLQTKNAEMERFVYTVSHDLKSPLVTIRGFLGWLKRHVDEGQAEKAAEDVGLIDQAVSRMGESFEGLLQLARSGQALNEPQDVDMTDLAEEVVEMLDGIIREHGVKVEIAPDMATIRGDRLRLRQVLENLLENAVKFMGDQPEPTVEIGQRDQKNGPVFFVRDNGIGVDPKYHEKVFELFDRLDPNIEGTGAGLAIVRRVVEAHGGGVWIESNGDGTGSTFCFTLDEVPSQPGE